LQGAIDLDIGIVVTASAQDVMRDMLLMYNLDDSGLKALLV
jgi:hypothetical protein